MAEYLAENGTIITEAMIDSWVEEIENGFPNSIIEPMSEEELAWWNGDKTDEYGIGK